MRTRIISLLALVSLLAGSACASQRISSSLNHHEDVSINGDGVGIYRGHRVEYTGDDIGSILGFLIVAASLHHNERRRDETPTDPWEGFDWNGERSDTENPWLSPYPSR